MSFTVERLERSTSRNDEQPAFEVARGFIDGKLTNADRRQVPHEAILIGYADLYQELWQKGANDTGRTQGQLEDFLRDHFEQKGWNVTEVRLPSGFLALSFSQTQAIPPVA